MLTQGHASEEDGKWHIEYYCPRCHQIVRFDISGLPDIDIGEPFGCTCGKVVSVHEIHVYQDIIKDTPYPNDFKHFVGHGLNAAILLQ